MTYNERKTMLALVETINGEINRMCYTKELTELVVTYGHAKRNLDRLLTMIHYCKFRAESEGDNGKNK